MRTQSRIGELARDLLGLYESLTGFASPREEGVRVRVTAFHLGHYQRDLIAFLRSKLTEGSVFFDVGANIGYVSREAARLVGATGRVLSFEPNPSVFALLSRNCRRCGNLTAHNVAVGEKQATLSLNFHRDHTGEASLVKSTAGDELVSVEVPVVVLASYLDGIDAASKIILKVDVEGFELPVLRGLDGDRLPDCVIAEFNPKWQRAAGYQSEEFYDWFSSKDYRVNLLGTGGSLSPLSLEQFIAKVAATSDTESFDCVGLPAPRQAVS